MSILNLSFNNDGSMLSCGTSNSMITYKLSPNKQKELDTPFAGGVCKTHLLGHTNLVALVGCEEPYTDNVMVFWDSSVNRPNIRVDVRETIMNVKICRGIIIIVLKRKICLFDFKGEFIDSKVTFSNDDGLCEFENTDDGLVIATLGLKKGDIAIWKPNLDNPYYKTITAHQNKIVALALSKNGDLVATASESGTNIHIFNTISGKEVNDGFRRGSTTAKICDLAFDKDNQYLACCSGNGTIHIFSLQGEEYSNTRSMFYFASGYIPQYFSSEWSPKKHSIRSTDKMICAFDQEGVLHIATYEGDYYRISGENYDILVRSNLYTNQ